MNKINKYREETKDDFERVLLMKRLKKELDNSKIPNDTKSMILFDLHNLMNNLCITCGSKIDNLGVNKTGICQSCYDKLNDKYRWFFNNHSLE